jgi:hypothetical protein
MKHPYLLVFGLLAVLLSACGNKPDPLLIKQVQESMSRYEKKQMEMVDQYERLSLGQDSLKLLVQQELPPQVLLNSEKGNVMNSLLQEHADYLQLYGAFLHEFNIKLDQMRQFAAELSAKEPKLDADPAEKWESLRKDADSNLENEREILRGLDNWRLVFQKTLADIRAQNNE